MKQVIVDGIDITNLLKAQAKFDDFRQDMKTERDQAGAIQAFEFSFELAWKTVKRILAKRGVDVRSPRDCIREAALNKLISQPEQWFIYLENRNKTSHVYDQDIALEIINIFEDFSVALSELINNLETSA